MKQIKAYLPNVLLTFLLVFALLAAELLIFAQALLTPATLREITKQKDLGNVTYQALEKTFAARSHSTGIPAEVIMGTLSQETLTACINGNTDAAFAYLQGSTVEQPDLLGDMVQSIRQFFESYADENGYEKDAAFEEKVASVTAETKQIIEEAADPFKLGTLQRNGWLDAGKKYLGYLKPAMLGSIVFAVLLMALIFLCNRKQKALLAYWYGLAALIPGILLLVPCIYLKATDYFAAFALKDPQIYAAVVGLLRLLTDRALLMGIITAVIGVVLLIVFAVIPKETAEE